MDVLESEDLGLDVELSLLLLLLNDDGRFLLLDFSGSIAGVCVLRESAERSEMFRPCRKPNGVGKGRDSALRSSSSSS